MLPFIADRQRCLAMLPFIAAFHCCTSSALVPSVLYHCSDPILSVFQEHDIASDKQRNRLCTHTLSNSNALWH